MSMIVKTYGRNHIHLIKDPNQARVHARTKKDLGAGEETLHMRRRHRRIGVLRGAGGGGGRRHRRRDRSRSTSEVLHEASAQVRSCSGGSLLH